MWDVLQPREIDAHPSSHRRWIFEDKNLRRRMRKAVNKGRNGEKRLTAQMDGGAPVIFPLSNSLPLCHRTAQFQCYDNGRQAKSKRMCQATLIPGLGEEPAPFEVPTLPLGAFQSSSSILRSPFSAILVELIPRVWKLNGLFECIHPTSAAEEG